MRNFPSPAVFLPSVLLLWLAAQYGSLLGLRRRRPLKDDVREDFGVIQAATLTLLGLIIGFSFSMAITRYDLRKNYEEAEANAIGTEYVRADLLPAAMRGGACPASKYLDCASCFTAPGSRTSFGTSMPIPRNCRPNCGLRCRLRPGAARHP